MKRPRFTNDELQTIWVEFRHIYEQSYDGTSQCPHLKSVRDKVRRILESRGYTLPPEDDIEQPESEPPR